jgi:hypothetical protein
MELESDVEEDAVQENAVEVAALLAVMEEQTCFRDAVGNPEWKKAMDSKIMSICKNETWELAPLPQGHKPIGLKWVYKLKRNSDGDIVKHKARLVAKGYDRDKVWTLKKCLLL